MMNLRNNYFLPVGMKRMLSLNHLNDLYFVERNFIRACSIKTNKKVNGQFFVAHSTLVKKEKSIKCHNCQNDINVAVPSFFCKSCKALVDVEVFKSFNIFELFTLDIDYDVNKTLLKQKFNDIQKMFHPDKNSRSAMLEKINEASGYLNNAYRLLNNDIDRATYMLELLFNYKMDENEGIQDEEFLQEIVKINEQIDNSGEIESLLKEYEKKYQNFVNELNLYFKEKKCDNIVMVLKKLKFVDKILERIKNM